jgi:ADP-heptose:LPS heptosyltransferase
LTTCTIGIKLIVGPAEEGCLDRVAQKLPMSHVDVLQNYSLQSLAVILRQSRLYLGNDSGISHLAAAAGAPSVVLFGPSNPCVWRPVGPNVRVLQGNGQSYCRGISVDDVWQAAVDMLKIS